MKSPTFAERLGLLVIVAAVITASPYVWAKLDTSGESRNGNLTRACVPAIGDVALTLAATTGTDADSGALNAGAVYMLRCDTDAWVRFGAAAVTAAADDWLVQSGEVYYIPTGGSEAMRHISALSVTIDGDCRLLECK